MKVENKQEILKRNLIKFYQNDGNMKKLHFFLTKDSDVSLREWDYLCTHYAKKNNIMYYTDVGGRKLINLNLEYRSQLKAYSKANFDPFKRHNRINIQCKYSASKELETTCGQLCFFKFVIEKDMYDWLKKGKNLENLRKDMNDYTKNKKGSSVEVQQKNKKHANRHDIKITVFF